MARAQRTIELAAQDRVVAFVQAVESETGEQVITYGGNGLLGAQLQDATPEQITLIGDTIKSSPTIIDVEKLQYLDKVQTYEEAKRIFAGDPVTLSLLTPENIPSQYKVVPLTDDAINVKLTPRGSDSTAMVAAGKRPSMCRVSRGSPIANRPDRNLGVSSASWMSRPWSISAM